MMLQARDCTLSRDEVFYLKPLVHTTDVAKKHTSRIQEGDSCILPRDENFGHKELEDEKHQPQPYCSSYHGSKYEGGLLSQTDRFVMRG